jgi:hypothetical protein
MRKQREHMFLEAMVTPVIALGTVVYVRLYSLGPNGRLEAPEGDVQPARLEMDDGQTKGRCRAPH